MGLAKAPARARPRCVHTRVLPCAASPGHGPSPGWGGGWGGVTSTRPPTCSEASLRAGDVSCPKWWLCPGPRCSPRPSCPRGRGEHEALNPVLRSWPSQKDGAGGENTRQSPRGAEAAGRELDPSPGCTAAGWGEMLRGGITPHPREPSWESPVPAEPWRRETESTHGSRWTPGRDIAAQRGHGGQDGFWRYWLVNNRTGRQRKDQ